MQYDAIKPMSRDEAERATASADPFEISQAVLAVGLNADDSDWAEAFCERFACHSDPGVRGSALLSFGHLARRFRKLDRGRVQTLLAAGLVAPDA